MMRPMELRRDLGYWKQNIMLSLLPPEVNHVFSPFVQWASNNFTHLQNINKNLEQRKLNPMTGRTLVNMSEQR